MPVYQDFGPGIGEGVDRFTQNLVSAMMMKHQMALQKQQAADQHQAAGDTHTSAAISNAVNYGFIPEGVPGPGGSPAAPSAPQSFEPDQGALRTMLQNMVSGSGANVPPVAAPIAAMPSRRGAVTPPSLLAPPSMLDRAAAPDPGANFQANLAASFQKAPSSAGPSGVAPSRAGAGAANLPGKPASSRVSIPGVGSIDPYAGFRRQLMLKGAEKDIDTQAAIEQAQGKGEVDRNRAETARAIREINTPRLGDQNFASLNADVKGQEAAASAAATMPAKLQEMIAQGKISRENGAALENLHAQHEMERQQDAQGFQKGQLTAAQVFQRQQARDAREGTFLNAIGVEQFKEGGQITPRINRAVLPGNRSAPTTAPSSTVGGRTVTINGRSYQLPPE